MKLKYSFVLSDEGFKHLSCPSHCMAHLDCTESSCFIRFKYTNLIGNQNFLAQNKDNFTSVLLLPAQTIVQLPQEQEHFTNEVLILLCVIKGSIWRHLFCPSLPKFSTIVISTWCFGDEESLSRLPTCHCMAHFYWNEGCLFIRLKSKNNFCSQIYLALKKLFPHLGYCCLWWTVTRPNQKSVPPTARQLD